MSKFTFIYTLLTSGVVYCLSYLMLTETIVNSFALGGFVIGLLVYLLIRKVYKQQNTYDKLLAKAYRLGLWLFPLAFILFKLSFFVFTEPGRPSFQDFVSFDDLSWSGPFSLVLWPMINIFVLINNIAVPIILFFYTFGIPALIALIVLFLVLLSNIFFQLKKLQSSSEIEFSLMAALVFTLGPLVLWIGVVSVFLP